MIAQSTKSRRLEGYDIVVHVANGIGTADESPLFLEIYIHLAFLEAVDLYTIAFLLEVACL